MEFKKSKTLCFELIADSRFIENTEEQANIYLKELLNKIDKDTNILFNYEPIRFISFGDSFQHRIYCEIVFNKNVYSYKDLYCKINSIKPVVYRFK